MNLKELTKGPHIFVELLLCVIIIILLISNKSDIKVDPKGFVKNIALNYALTGDGAVLVSDPEGNVILRSEQDSLDTLHSIAITTIGKKNDDSVQGLLDSIIPTASATTGKFFKIRSNVDGQIICRWYNDHTPC